MTLAAGEIEGRLELLPATPLSLLVEQASRALGMARSVTEAHRLVLVSTSRADGRPGLKSLSSTQVSRGCGSVGRGTRCLLPPGAGREGIDDKFTRRAIEALC